METFIFENRAHAGRLLAGELKVYKNSDAIVLAIPRGGVPVGFELAKHLNLPLEIILSKKISYPDNEEYAIGAVSADSVVLNPDVDLHANYIQSEAERLRKILMKRYDELDSHLEEISLKNRTVILTDDGIATGSTLLACIATIRRKGAARIIVAAPVVPQDRIETIRNAADEFIYLQAPDYFRGVGGFYDDFEQVEDLEVRRLLAASRKLG